MTAKQVEKLLEERSPFIIYSERNKIEWTFNKGVLFMDNKVYSSYLMEEGSTTFNIQFTDILYYPLINFRIWLKTDKEIIVNYQPDKLKERSTENTKNGMFILYPKDKPLFDIDNELRLDALHQIDTRRP